MVSANRANLLFDNMGVLSRTIDEFNAKLDNLINSEKYFKNNKKTYRFINIRTRPRLYYRHHDIYDSNTRYRRRRRNR